MLFHTVLAAAVATTASALAIEKRASITDFDSSPVKFSFPPGRSGFAPGMAANAPCGGAPMGERTKFPLTGGTVSLVQKTSVDNVNILWTKGEPTRFHQFATYTSTVSDLGAGHYCAPGPDFTSLGLAEGDDATLLVIYQMDGQEKGMYYHCADVSLVSESSFTKPDYVCGNYTGELEVASGADSMSLSGTEGNAGSSGHSSSGSVSTTSNKEDGLSNAAAGGIGAGVTLGVVGLLAAALVVLGRLHFGKKKNVSFDDASSISSGVPTKQVSRN